MKRPAERHPSFPLHDYREALQGAVSWLGDRHLLAAPVVGRRDVKPPLPILASAGRWRARYRGG